MKKRRLKKSAKLGLIGIAAFIILIIIIVNAIKTANYHKTYEYKILELGYTEEQTEELLKLDDNKIDYILSLDYNEVIPDLFNETYFIYNKIDLYLDFYSKNSNMKLSKIVSMVNVKTNYQHYDTNIMKETDISLGNLMLVNKYNYLTEDYAPSNLEEVSTVYAYSGHLLLPEANSAYVNMAKDANSAGYRLIVNSSYRSYEKQSSVWTSRSYNYGDDEADNYTARAGHSEHQTGLAIDLTTNVDYENFEDTDAYTWLINNSYKYGFILRYPEGMEDITGYEYESWHYRYVGVDVATKIHNLGITFDEYYAYYIEK